MLIFVVDDVEPPGEVIDDADLRRVKKYGRTTNNPDGCTCNKVFRNDVTTDPPRLPKNDICCVQLNKGSAAVGIATIVQFKSL